MGTAFIAVALLLAQAVPSASGGVSGRIFSMNGEPAVSARVQAIREPENPGLRADTIMGFALTDADGKFRIDNLPVGRYFLAVGSVDNPTYYPGVAAIKNASAIDIHAGELLAGFEFKMVVPPPLKITGRVNAADGQTRSIVRLMGPTNMTSASAADGTFQFTNLRPGDYDVSVLRTVSGAAPSTPLPIRVTLSDRDITGLELGTPPASVSVSVDVERDGPHPLFQLTFSATGTGASSSGISTTSAVRPDLSLNLLPGTYRVAVSGLPDGFSVRSIKAGETELGTNGLVTAASKDSIKISISLGVGSPLPWVKVRGKVTGKETANVRAVEFNSSVLTELLSAPVAPDGSFELPTVISGTYTVRPSPPAGYFPRTLIVGRLDISDVDVSPPTTQDLVGDFVSIMSGEFMMGCSAGDTDCLPEESPSHKVAITKGFEIGRYEVMQLQWEALMGSNPSQYKGETLPVENINTWEMVESFLAKLNTLKDGYRYRIPTEAEWEYAARAGSTAPYFGPMDSVAWHGGNSLNGVLIITNLVGGTVVTNAPIRLVPTHPVGQLQPNAWGLYDMQGNVWEWTSDWYDAQYYSKSPAADPKGPDSGPMRVMKGGSAVVAPPLTRVSVRGNQPATNASYIFGLRLVRDRIQ